MRLKKLSITTGVALIMSSAGAGTALAQPTGSTGLPEPLAPVASLDVPRYLGAWNQLAAIPQPFNLDCARDTRAEYTVIDAANVGVANTCSTWSGGSSGITGNARVVDPATNAQLHVSFPSVPFQSSPDGPANYVVTHIADDYSWALVGGPARTSGFVLSRSPNVSQAQWSEIRATVEARDYNACLFLTSPTTGGRESIQPLCTV